MPENEIMEEHVSFHGTMTQKQAVKILKESGINCYLIRFSNSLGMYIITVYRKRPVTVENFGLIINKKSETDRYGITNMEKKFKNIDDLLNFYETNRIHPSFESIGTRYTKQDHIIEDQRRPCCNIL